LYIDVIPEVYTNVVKGKHFMMPLLHAWFLGNNKNCIRHKGYSSVQLSLARTIIKI